MKMSSRLCLFAGLAACAASPALAQVLYDNGPLVTHPGGGAGGLNASALQTALGLATYGWGAQLTASNRMADDFTVPAGGWNIGTIEFYSYQTTAAAPSITAINVQIWNGKPGDATSTVVFGDPTTNRLSAGNPVILSNTYRVLDTGLLDTARRVQTVTADIGATLAAGTYWLDWQYDGSVSFSGPWQPPVTILGQTGKPGANGLQSLAGAWAPLLDPATTGSPQDLPFIINGPGTAVTGACCVTSGCITVSQASCTAQGGIYRGDGAPCATANCPLPGACCLPDGSCSILLSSACTAANGIFRGEGSNCGTANCPLPAGIWIEQGEAGNLPPGQITTGSGSLNEIRGGLTGGDVDMYKITICNAAAFTAIMGGNISDTQIFLFDSTGKGVAMNDDTPVGTGLLSALAPAGAIAGLTNGTYYIAVSSYDNDPNDSGALALWLDTPYNTVRAPDGPGAANPVAAWDGAGTNAGNYTIALTGACYGEPAAASCYANCDASTIAPCLNVNDFICFNNTFAAGSPAANCDASTIAPTLNVNDFICFNNKFAAGCTNPCAAP